MANYSQRRLFREVVADGDLRASLEALRDELAEAFDDANPAIKAQLAGRLQAVLTQLHTLPAGKVSSIDDLSKRRADRLSGAESPMVATRASGKRGK